MDRGHDQIAHLSVSAAVHHPFHVLPVGGHHPFAIHTRHASDRHLFNLLPSGCQELDGIQWGIAAIRQATQVYQPDPVGGQRHHAHLCLIASDRHLSIYGSEQ